MKSGFERDLDNLNYFRSSCMYADLNTIKKIKKTSKKAKCQIKNCRKIAKYISKSKTKTLNVCEAHKSFFFCKNKFLVEEIDTNIAICNFGRSKDCVCFQLKKNEPTIPIFDEFDCPYLKENKCENVDILSVPPCKYRKKSEKKNCIFLGNVF